MNGIGEAREQLAAAASQPGVPVFPYPPDAASAPCGWVDGLQIDYETAGSFCLPGTVTCQVVLVGQRHDRPGTTATLETSIQPTVDALADIPGVLVTGVESGAAEIGGETVPSVMFNLRFHITS